MNEIQKKRQNRLQEKNTEKKYTHYLTSMGESINVRYHLEGPAL